MQVVLNKYYHGYKKKVGLPDQLFAGYLGR
jgi:hypothetical protein